MPAPTPTASSIPVRSLPLQLPPSGPASRCSGTPCSAGPLSGGLSPAPGILRWDATGRPASQFPSRQALRTAGPRVGWSRLHRREMGPGGGLSVPRNLSALAGWPGAGIRAAVLGKGGQGSHLFPRAPSRTLGNAHCTCTCPGAHGSAHRHAPSLKPRSARSRSLRSRRRGPGSGESLLRPSPRRLRSP